MALYGLENDQDIAMLWNRQLDNRNFLSPIGFKMLLEQFPKVPYFSQSANIPGIGLNTIEQPTMLGRPVPWDAHGLNYEPFTLTFLVDEDLENYLIIHNWMRGISGGNHTWERGDYEEQYTPRCDGSLAVMNSNMQTNFFVNFKDLFPVSLNALEFNATIDGTEYATASVEFRYTSYDIVDKEGVRRTTLE